MKVKPILKAMKSHQLNKQTSQTTTSNTYYSPAKLPGLFLEQNY